MKVATVLNYKGGVGKTTLTANIGAEIARRGKRVLLVDLDPQASLTLSLYRPEQWPAELAPSRTIKHWLESKQVRGGRPSLEPFITSPPRANFYVPNDAGRIDLVASDLSLGDVEDDLASEVRSARSHRSNDRYARVFRRIVEALDTVDSAGYDLVLLDCPPNFGIMTRSALLAMSSRDEAARYVAGLGSVPRLRSIAGALGVRTWAKDPKNEVIRKIVDGTLGVRLTAHAMGDAEAL